jgi:hypothetical protein
MPEKPSYQKSERWNSVERIKWLERLKVDEEAQAVEIARCKKDPWYWLMHYVYTEDTHNRDKPFQKFPDLPHLFYLTRIWQEERRLLVPKSRQMSCTWLFCALYLWDAIHYPSRMTFFVSKKEVDSDSNVQRALVMYEKLPRWYRDFCPPADKKTPYTFCQLKFANRSRIWGIPSGGDQMRQYTASGIFLDEFAFLDEVKEQLASAIPTLGRHGRITGVSSPAPSYFGDLVFQNE